MTDNTFPIDRRAILGGLGATFLLPTSSALPQSRAALVLEAMADTIVLKPGQPPTPIWRLAGGPDNGPLRFNRGETVDVTLTNRLSVPVVLNWTGLDGNPAAEPLAGRAPTPPNASTTTQITFRHAGTITADIRLLGDAIAQPSPARPVIVTEAESLAIDRDEVMLFQDWRLKTDGTALMPGVDTESAATVFTVNGGPTFDLTLAQNQRARVRLINACQRDTIAIKIADHEVRIIAIDGQPSEPFLARDGLVVLTAGSRADVVIDAVRPPGSTSPIMLLDGRDARPIGRIIVSGAKPARPAPLPTMAALPTNGLPAQLDLKSALRVDLAINAPTSADWVAPTILTPSSKPAFKVKRGRTVVLAVSNRGAKPAVFHLHGHHFRLLDRLDDGWKPFWLDTLAIDTGQTQRIAFAAEFAGLYPMQTMATDWGSARLMRSYLIE